MESVFQTIVTLSVVGSLLTVLLIWLRPITQKAFNSRWQYAAWMIVLLVLVFPYSLRIPVQVPQTSVQVQAEEFLQSQAVQIYHWQETQNTIAQETGAQKEKPSGMVPSKLPTQAQIAETVVVDVKALLAKIWLLGVMGFMLYMCMSYGLFVRRMKRCSTLVADEKALALYQEIGSSMKIKKAPALYFNAAMHSPMLVGILKPKIVLPGIKNDVQLNDILRHELTHFKRRDLVVKAFAVLVNALHWFNPFVYVAVKRLNRECEISCDEIVVQTLSEEGRKQYAQTLMTAVENAVKVNTRLSTAMTGDKKDLKIRFKKILHFKGKSKAVILISVVMAFILLATGIALVSFEIHRNNNEIVFTQTVDGVTLMVQPDKSIYAQGDIIGLTVTLINHRENEIAIYKPFSDVNAHWEVATTLKLGSDIELTDLDSTYPKDGKATPTFVKPGKIYVQKMRFAYYSNGQKVDLPIGTYQGIASASVYINGYNPEVADDKGISTKFQIEISDNSKTYDQEIPFFAQKEIATARSVVEQWFEANNNKDKKTLSEIWQYYNNRKDEAPIYDIEFNLLSISYDPFDYRRESYVQDHKEIPSKNLLIFRTNYNVKITGSNDGGWDGKARYDYMFILIRKDKNSPWMIYDMGY